MTISCSLLLNRHPILHFQFLIYWASETSPTQSRFRVIGERAKRVKHPLSLPIEKNVWVVCTSKPQCACSQFYVKRRSRCACIYEKPACCSREQLGKALFTYVKTTKRQSACTSNNFTFARPLKVTNAGIINSTPITDFAGSSYHSAEGGF